MSDSTNSKGAAHLSDAHLPNVDEVKSPRPRQAGSMLMASARIRRSRAGTAANRRPAAHAGWIHRWNSQPTHPTQQLVDRRLAITDYSPPARSAPLAPLRSSCR